MKICCCSLFLLLPLSKRFALDWIGGDAGRPAFHRFLAEAIERGLGKRIMFGSDEMGWPDAIGLAIKGLDSAPFQEQKSDIFYRNAMRCFLVLGQINNLLKPHT